MLALKCRIVLNIAISSQNDISKAQLQVAFASNSHNFSGIGKF